MPDATLKVSMYCDFPRNDEEKDMKKIIDNHSSSIKFLGKLNTTDLYNLMAETEYWFYLCLTPETSCITALEMLKSGVICLYYPLGGLTYTMSDFGIQVKSGNEIETLMSLTEEMKSSIISRGKKYANTCSWKNRAKVWENIIFHPELV